LPEHLNATAVVNDDFEVAIVELDEQWSFVGNKKNQEWLWLVFHSETRQVLAMHVGKRTRQSAEILLKKQINEQRYEDLEKNPLVWEENYDVSLIELSKSIYLNSNEK
jgi:IS1 family transposase